MQQRLQTLPKLAAVAILVLTVGALSLSVFMVWHGHEDQGDLPGCGPDGECSVVLGSRWATWAGIPIGFLGVGCYASLLTALVLARYVQGGGIRDLALWAFMAVLSLSGIVFVVWLTGVQGLLLHHFCVFCMSAHALGVVAFALVIRYAPIWKQLPRARLRLGAPAGLVAVALITVHVLFAPDIMVIESVADMEFAAAGEAASGGGIRIGRPKPKRVVELLEGQLSFELDTVPLIGDPDAPHVFLELYDYACPSCRELYKKLKQFKEERAGTAEITVVPLPVPMHPDCNPDVKKVLPGFQEACTYARLAMAVCALDRDRFPEYHDYLMQGGWVPSVDKARKKAAELVGEEALAKALEKAEGEQWMQDGMGIFKFIKAKTLPKLIVGDTVISYSGSSRRKLFDTLDELLEKDAGKEGQASDLR